MLAEAKPRWRSALPERQLAEMLVVRNRGFAVGTGTLVMNAIACTVQFELARRLRDHEFSIFAPTTTAGDRVEDLSEPVDEELADAVPLSASVRTVRPDRGGQGLRRRSDTGQALSRTPAAGLASRAGSP